MAYSNDLRKRAVDHYLNIKRNYKEVSSIYKIGVATVYEWVKRFRENGNIDKKKITGRPKLIPEEEKNNLKKMVLENSDDTLSMLSDKWLSLTGRLVTISTLSRSIKRVGLTRKKKVF